jgi:hypothetical protein
MAKKLYKFDVFVVAEDSEEYRKIVAFFTQVRSTDPEQSTSQTRKGLLRIRP